MEKDTVKASNEITKRFFSRGVYRDPKLKRKQPQGPYYCEYCKNEYKGISGLWKHLKKMRDSNDSIHLMNEDKKKEAIKAKVKEIAKTLEEILEILTIPNIPNTYT